MVGIRLGPREKTLDNTTCREGTNLSKHAEKAELLVIIKRP